MGLHLLSDDNIFVFLEQILDEMWEEGDFFFNKSLLHV